MGRPQLAAQPVTNRSMLLLSKPSSGVSRNKLVECNGSGKPAAAGTPPRVSAAYQRPTGEAKGTGGTATSLRRLARRRSAYKRAANSRQSQGAMTGTQSAPDRAARACRLRVRQQNHNRHPRLACALEVAMLTNVLDRSAAIMLTMSAWKPPPGRQTRQSQNATAIPHGWNRSAWSA